MRFGFILVEKAFYPVTVLCRLLAVSRSGFHAWIKRPPSPRKLQDQVIAAEVNEAFRKSRGTYGSPRMTKEFRANGRRIARKRVARIMREQNLQARPKRRFKTTTDSNHAGPFAPNILRRKFCVDAPNRIWVTDVKAIWTHEGWIYLAPVIDLYSRRVVGHALRDWNDTDLALAAINSAAANRNPPPGLLHHSDRGRPYARPYASVAYRARLDELECLMSMSRKGNCWDNAVAESFFSTLTHELLLKRHTHFSTRQEAADAVTDYIENFYNTQRRHSSIGYVSPVEYELGLHHAADAA